MLLVRTTGGFLLALFLLHLSLEQGGKLMSVELWLGIGHYLLGVLVIFALVVALMETSRKFDRFHDNSYLLLATGYFLLVVWALIRAMAIGPGILQLVAIICLILGLVCLVFGYYFLHHAHPNDGEEESKPLDAAKTPKVDLKEAWMKMLSADEEPPVPEQESEQESEPEPEPEEEPDVDPEPAEVATEASTSAEPAPVAPARQAKKLPPKQESVEPEASEIDLSYLSKRVKKAKESTSVVEPSQTLAEPISEVPVKAIKKVAKKVSKKSDEPVKESREEIMDDLFPLTHKAKKKKSVVPSNTDILPGEGAHDA